VYHGAKLLSGCLLQLCRPSRSLDLVSSPIVPTVGRSMCTIPQQLEITCSHIFSPSARGRALRIAASLCSLSNPLGYCPFFRPSLKAALLGGSVWV
jgi:hypothetical protein